jgi:Glycosyltransferase sugar-binding region containing DXD motif
MSVRDILLRKDLSMPIKNQAFFFWGRSTPLPYARYLTLATYRIHHPDNPMYLYQCRCNDEDKWGAIFQDFQFNYDEMDKCFKAYGVDFNDQNLKDHIKSILLPKGDPQPWDRIKYDSDKIIKIFQQNIGKDNLTIALTNLVKDREAREAKRPAKHDYIQDAVERLGVTLCEYQPQDQRVYTMPPPNVSDIFSVEILAQQGGWYFDLDQLIMKNMDNLGAHYDFLAGGQTAFYIGVFGSRAGGKVVGDFYSKMLGGYQPEFYNSTGISAIVKECINKNDWLDWFKKGPEINHITAQEMFYPLCAWDAAKRFWSGEYDILSNKESYTCHYFGGHAISQKYFRELNPENLFQENHCMGRYLKKYAGHRKELCLA